MRIFLTCLQSPKTHAISAYQHWERYFKRGIEEAGHQWVEEAHVDWVEPLVLRDGDAIDRWRERAWTKTVARVKKEVSANGVDLFLSYLYPHMVDGGAIGEIRRLGVPCVNFFCDNVREFRTAPREYQPFDLHWVPEWQALEMYRRAGLKYVHAAMPCWVPPDQRTCSHPESFGVTFIGSPDALRRELFGHAIQLGADLRIYGFGWNGELNSSSIAARSWRRLLTNQWRDVRKQGFQSWLWKFERRFRPLRPPPEIPQHLLMGKVPTEDFVRVMQQSVVTVGVNRVSVPYRSLRQPVTYSRLRDIEAPMLGACYLTEWAEDLEHLYELGTEIETYRTAEELLEQMKRLKADPARRNQLRAAGQQRALAEHSVGRSLRRLIDALGMQA